MRRFCVCLFVVLYSLFPGSTTVSALLIGDARTGNWSFSSSLPGSFENQFSAATIFNWTGGGSFTFSFSPESVCPTPATRTVEVLASCPQTLSREATIRIAVGASLGAHSHCSGSFGGDLAVSSLESPPRPVSEERRCSNAELTVQVLGEINH